MTVIALTADGRKIVVGSAAGPASDVTVTAGSQANVDIAVPMFELGRKNEALAVKSIEGLPNNIVLVGFSWPTLDTLRLRVFNHSGTNVTVTANSVTVTVTLLGT